MLNLLSVWLRELWTAWCAIAEDVWGILKRWVTRRRPHHVEIKNPPKLWTPDERQREFKQLVARMPGWPSWYTSEYWLNRRLALFMGDTPFNVLTPNEYRVLFRWRHGSRERPLEYWVD